MQGIRQLDRAPWIFRISSFLIDQQVRGGYRLLDVATRMGLLNCRVRYVLGNRVSLDVPLYRPDNQWTRDHVLGYDQTLLDSLSDLVNRLPGPVALVDCGADIGTVSALLASRCPSLQALWAFEPNPIAFDVLRRNVASLPFPGYPYNAAVSDRSGRGRLQRSVTDSSDHAMFLAAADDGDIDVVRIDDLNLGHPQSLVLKIDVEGCELNVLRGSIETLARVPNWVITFEAHRDVYRRTGIDPMECLRLLRSIRPCEAFVGDLPEIALDFTRPYFEQVREMLVSGVICHS